MACSRRIAAKRTEIAISRTWGVMPLERGASALRRCTCACSKNGDNSHALRKLPVSSVPMRISFTRSTAIWLVPPIENQPNGRAHLDPRPLRSLHAAQTRSQVKTPWPTHRLPWVNRRALAGLSRRSGASAPKTPMAPLLAGRPRVPSTRIQATAMCPRGVTGTC